MTVAARCLSNLIDRSRGADAGADAGEEPAEERAGEWAAGARWARSRWTKEVGAKKAAGSERKIGWRRRWSAEVEREECG